MLRFKVARSRSAIISIQRCRRWIRLASQKRLMKRGLFCHGYPMMPIPAMKSARRFADNHAFASIIGEGCALEAMDFDLGLFLIAPNLFYRDHHHAAPELYAPLTGPHGWRFKPGDPLVWKEAHEPIWNRAWQPHATMTGDTPFLAIFCWTNDVALPAKVIPSSDWPNLENAS